MIILKNLECCYCDVVSASPFIWKMESTCMGIKTDKRTQKYQKKEP